MMKRSLGLSGGVRGEKKVKKPTSPHKDDDGAITLTVWGQDGSDVCFKIKRAAELQLLMTAYCNNKELCIKDVRFIHDGRFLKGWQTVDDVGLKDGDKIDVMASMDGGGCSNV